MIERDLPGSKSAERMSGQIDARWVYLIIRSYFTNNTQHVLFRRRPIAKPAQPCWSCNDVTSALRLSLDSRGIINAAEVRLLIPQRSVDRNDQRHRSRSVIGRWNKDPVRDKLSIRRRIGSLNLAALGGEWIGARRHCR